MIKLDRTPKPSELTLDLQKELTKKFISTGESVWNLDFIKKWLSDYSNGKCCYCETSINTESKYLEVEHFHHKNTYKDEVLEWTNLLPSCKRCNWTKNNHDTIVEPIIDPTVIDPKLHLKYWEYRLKGKDDLGKLTISVLNLNDWERLVKKRFEIGNAIHEKLEQFNEITDDYINWVENSTRRKNRIIKGIKELMGEGLPSSIYSATAATIILNDTEFIELREKLINLNIWDTELEELETDLRKIAFEVE